MFEEIGNKKIINKIVSLGISALLLFLFLLLKLNKIQLINELYIILALVFSLLLLLTIAIFKYKESSRKYFNYYYQVVDFMFLLNMAILIIQIFFMVAYYPVVVDGASMSPTLFDDERLIVRSLGEPANGSIVVLRIDEKYNRIGHVENGEELVKRVIAVPGDTFYYNIDNQLVLNGNVVVEKYLLDENGKFYNNPSYRTKTEPFNIKDVVDCDSTTTCVIPDGFYFVMGDNRGNSYDSRNFGLVHESQILGLINYRKVSFLVWEKVQ